MVNETIKTGGFPFTLPYRDECRFPTNTDRLTYKVFDRYGLKTEVTKYTDRSRAPIRIWIETEGEPPFVFAGLSPQCARVQDTAAEIKDGFAIPLSLNRFVSEVPLSIQLGTGVSTASIEWTPAPETYGYYQIWLDVDVPQWVTRANMTLYDATGNISRTDEFTPTGGSSYFPTFMMIEGTYRMEVEIEPIPPEPTTWTYVVETSTFTDDVCVYDLEWSICQ